MAAPISEEKKLEMFEVWRERQSINYVATRCQVSRTTANRWRDKDNWDNRLDAIKQQAQKKADYEYAKERGKYVRAVGTILNYGINEKLQKIKNKQDIDLSDSMVDKFIRLLEFLVGEKGDEHGGITNTGSGDINFINIDNCARDEHEERYDKLEERYAKLFGGNGSGNNSRFKPERN